jgi:hypothetical protein
MQEKILAMIGNDAGAQQRYFDTFRRSEYLEPEKELLLAVLEDAVHCYRKYASARSRAGKEQFREAEEWLMGGGDGWIFAFANVCDLLGLDPDYVRRAVRESKVAPVHTEPKERGRMPHRQAA